jgi:hypothetical protein
MLANGLAGAERVTGELRALGESEKTQSSKLLPISRRPYPGIILTRHRKLQAVPSGCFQR